MKPSSRKRLAAQDAVTEEEDDIRQSSAKQPDTIETQGVSYPESLHRVESMSTYLTVNFGVRQSYGNSFGLYFIFEGCIQHRLKMAVSKVFIALLVSLLATSSLAIQPGADQIHTLILARLIISCLRYHT